MIQNDPDFNKLFEREVLLLRTIQSNHIVKIHDIVKSKHHFYLIMEYCNGGSLQDLMSRRKFLSETEAHFIIKQITDGFVQLYNSNVIHRDLKPDNIMLNFPSLPEIKQPRKIF